MSGKLKNAAQSIRQVHADGPIAPQKISMINGAKVSVSSRESIEVIESFLILRKPLAIPAPYGGTAPSLH